MPALAFAVWSYQQLATDARQSRELLVGETLRALTPPPGAPLWLPAESNRLDTPLMLYRGGELRETSDPLYNDLAPIGRYLSPEVELNLSERDEETSTQLEQVDGSAALFGYRAFNIPESPSTVIGAPARADELTLGRRRRDLGVLVLFATAVGALAALWLSGIVARQLSSPIGTLRQAALSLAGGARTLSFEAEPMAEFSPVFNAFRRMAADLNSSRSALEEAQRRTVGRASQRGERRRGRRLGRPRVARQSARRVGARRRAGARRDRSRRMHRHPSRPSLSVFSSRRTTTTEFELSLDQMQLRGTLDAPRVAAAPSSRSTT